MTKVTMLEDLVKKYEFSVLLITDIQEHLLSINVPLIKGLEINVLEVTHPQTAIAKLDDMIDDNYMFHLILIENSKGVADELLYTFRERKILISKVHEFKYDPNDPYQLRNILETELQPEKIFLQEEDRIYSQGRPRMLIVEDNPLDRRIMRQIFNPEEFQIVTTGKGARAIELVNNRNYDVILLNNHLRDKILGTEVLKAIAKNNKLSKHKSEVIMISSAESDILETVPYNQVFDVLSKPIDPDLLSATVDKCVLQSTRKVIKDYMLLKKLLIVDDNRNISIFLKEILNKVGFKHVTSESNPVTALELIASTNFDMIISDYYMKTHTGLELLSKARVKNPETKSILISGAVLQAIDDPSSQTLGMEVFNAGINGFLRKPFSATQLLNSIASILDEDDKIKVLGGYEEPPPDYEGLLVILTGPYCAGKTFFARRLIEEIRGLRFLNRLTNRPVRSNELPTGGGLVHLKELDFKQILALMDEPVYYEHGGYQYFVHNAMIDFKNTDLIVTPDYSGFKLFQEHFPNSISLCLYSNPDDLRTRMEDTRDPNEIKSRMKNLDETVKQYNEHFPRGETGPGLFDIVILNKNPILEGDNDHWYAEERFFETFDLHYHQIASVILSARNRRIEKLKEPV